MILSLRIACMFALVMYFMLIFYFLKKGKLNLKYTLLWILSGLIMLLVVIWPSFFEFITRLMGVQEFTNGIFALVCFFILIILMSLTSIVSRLNDKNKVLIQQAALLEKRVREIEKKKELDLGGGVRS